MISLGLLNNITGSGQYDAKVLVLLNNVKQGWNQDFSDERLTLPTRGLKYSFRGDIYAQSPRK